MINYITGKITEKNPAFVTIEANGVGYGLSISLTTYSSLDGKELRKSEKNFTIHF